MNIVVVGNFARWLISFRGPLLREMTRKGHTVYACAPRATEGIICELEAMGVKYVDIPVDRDGTRLRDELGLFLFLFRLFRRLSPDLVLGYTIKPVIYGSLAARLAGVGSVFSMIEGLGYVFSGEGDDRRLFRTLIECLYAVAMRLNTRVFFLNSNDRKYFLDNSILPHGSRSVLLAGIGVDTEAYPPAPLPGQVSFLFAARLIYDKGIIEYVNAARKIKADYPGIVFKVAGWVDENPSAITHEQLRGWQDEGVIEYLGNLDSIRDALASSTVFVLPTFYREGVPRSIMEAMAMGRPVITTDIPGCRDAVIHAVTGLLVPPRQVPALVSAMETFIAQPWLAGSMGEKGRQLACARFDVHVNNRIVCDTMGIS